MTKEFAELKNKNPNIKHGNVVVTKPGSLRAAIKCVIHAVGPIDV